MLLKLRHKAKVKSVLVYYTIHVVGTKNGSAQWNLNRYSLPTGAIHLFQLIPAVFLGNMESFVSKRRLCFIYIASIQVCIFLGHICSVFIDATCCIIYNANLKHILRIEDILCDKDAVLFYLGVIVPLVIGPILAFTIGDGIYQRQV